MNQKSTSVRFAWLELGSLGLLQALERLLAFLTPVAPLDLAVAIEAGEVSRDLQQGRD